MASGPITSWQIDWETLETVIDFIFLGFPCGTADKESACNVGYVVSISGLGRSPGEGKGYPLQYSGLESSMDSIVHVFAKSRTWQSDFHFHFFLGSNITAAGDCSHEIKSCLLLGRKAVTNLDSILKSRDITLQTRVCTVKVMVFAIVMYGCESWTIKKAEHQRIYAFQLWCWRRFLRVP